MKKSKSKVWLKLPAIAEEKAALKVGCTPSIEDGEKVLVLVDYRGRWIPKTS